MGERDAWTTTCSPTTTSMLSPSVVSLAQRVLCRQAVAPKLRTLPVCATRLQARPATRGFASSARRAQEDLSGGGKDRAAVGVSLILIFSLSHCFHLHQWFLGFHTYGGSYICCDWFWVVPLFPT